ncbi:hypothetical protein J437_LFUL010912 [Ladona fulva]|uniref:Endonuclease/exonuclease/phosphatase domain-containing protein n=1 Tax=Ladona fulva TaxID=123851 RepID=A0A8K0P0J1_LADFU|nr:hypothetical protein J437_LFUL010912 [Ladona fulva]
MVGTGEINTWDGPKLAQLPCVGSPKARGRKTLSKIPVPPCWGLVVGLTTPHCKNSLVFENKTQPWTGGDNGIRPLRASRKHELRIATWSVRTMLKPGRMKKVADEMQKYRIDVMGLQEIRWQGQRRIDKKVYTLLFSGGEYRTGRFGTGFMISSIWRVPGTNALNQIDHVLTRRRAYRGPNCDSDHYLVRAVIINAEIHNRYFPPLMETRSLCLWKSQPLQSWLSTPKSFAASFADLDNSILSIIDPSWIPSKLPIKSPPKAAAPPLMEGFRPISCGQSLRFLVSLSSSSFGQLVFGASLCLLVLASSSPLASEVAATMGFPPKALSEDECFLRWRSMLCLRVKRRAQISHEKGRSPV